MKFILTLLFIAPLSGCLCDINKIGEGGCYSSKPAPNSEVSYCREESEDEPITRRYVFEETIPSTIKVDNEDWSICGVKIHPNPTD